MSEQFDVFARAGCHGNNPDIKQMWFWMDTREAASPEDAARAVHDEVKAAHPESWDAWTLADFKASLHGDPPDVDCRCDRCEATRAMRRLARSPRTEEET